MKFIFVTVLLNVLAISIWSAITGQNGFVEAAKMLRGEPAFIAIPSANTASGNEGDDTSRFDEDDTGEPGRWDTERRGTGRPGNFDRD